MSDLETSNDLEPTSDIESSNQSEQSKPTINPAYANVFKSQDKKTVKVKEPGKGIPGSTLKIIAIVSMFIDHFAAIVLGDKLEPILKANDVIGVKADPAFYAMIFMRCIGRLGFPLFCFLLIEGFMHTHDKAKYALRLLIFALISEVPFDLGINHSILEFSYQNVFFTLFLGLVVLILFEKLQIQYYKSKNMCFFAQSVVFITFFLLASLLRTDYGGIGIVTIVVMYWFRMDRKKEAILGSIALCISSPLEVFAFLTVPIVSKYNGERGLRLKYVFYAFYPLHILLLAGLSHLLGYR